MHFSIRYLTEYRYDAQVTDNLNALRVTPATTATQRVDDFGVRVEPQTRLHQHLDYFGTTVIEFGISKPHESLAIDVRARVATANPPAPPDGHLGRDRGAGLPRRRGRVPPPGRPASPTTCASTSWSAWCAPTRRWPRWSASCRWSRTASSTAPGVTYVGSTIEDLLEAGAGVCQDFAHLALVLLRRNGIAVRYVSGYLFAESGADAASAEVETHAWLEALLPADDGGEPVWVGVDPTNRCLAGETYVKIGHGRHYRDVPPVKGVFRGTAAARLEASVRMHRTDPAGARA